MIREIVVVDELGRELGSSLLSLLILADGVDKAEIESLLSSKPVAPLHLSEAFIDGLARLVGIERGKHLVEVLEGVALRLKLADERINLLLVALLIFIDEGRNIMYQKEAAFDNVDGFASEHSNSSD